jgi:hypothetical protein
MPSRITLILKSLHQLGLRPLVLYALYRLGLKTGYYKRAERRRIQTNPSLSAHLFALPDRAQLISTLTQDGRQTLLAEADEIVSGKFRMFGGEPVPLQLAGDWPPAHWTLYETGRIKLDGDIKFIWEPARFGWAFTLGRAYHLTQNETYAETFWKYFEQFDGSSPRFLGPHWMNGQEVAIRLLSLVWAAHVFETASSSNPARREQLIQSLYAHASRIPSTLIYARSQNNNHLLTEAAALYTAGLLFRHPQWRGRGWNWLNWALEHQIGEYGEYIQHSTNYHRLMLQTALWINLIKQDVWPPASTQALARASHWLFSLLDNASGRTPNLGANDGAMLFPLSGTHINDFRPTVQAAARAFLRTGLTPGPWDEMSSWFGLPASGRTAESDAYLTDNLHGQSSWGYLRASRFKSRLTHMDQLHFDLWWRGLNLAQDAGTYLYNAGPPWDNPLVSARVHNTVTVDGRDQMRRGGRFLVLDWFPAYSKNVFEMDESVLGRIRAYHKGYGGIRHERTVTVYSDERWTVEDKLISRVPHTYRLHWLLLDGEWEIVERGPGVGLRLKSPQGWITIRVMAGAKPGLEVAASLVRAGELLFGRRDVQPYEGWASPTYGVKVPALSLEVVATSSHPVTFTSEFTFPPAQPRQAFQTDQTAWNTGTIR